MDAKVRHTQDLAELLRSTADRLEKEDHGNLTGVAIVIEAVPGTFKDPGPMTGTWVSMQGGKDLYRGLLRVAFDISALRNAKKSKVQ